MKPLNKLSFFSICVLLSLILCFVLGGCKEKTPAKHTKAPKKAATPKVEQKLETISGKVVETMNSNGYTYMLLESQGHKIWVATLETPVSVGQEVELAAGQMMTNFTSKTLNRTFDRIIFSPGLLKGRSNPHVSNPHKGMTSPHKSSHASNRVQLAPEGGLKIEKAPGPNGYSVAEIYAKREELAGKKVQVRGKVVKVSKNIMGMNWVHIQDGTGDPSKGDFDLVVTTQDEPNKGDIVLVEGTVHANKDFGAGYRYDVIIQDAKIKKEK